MRAPSTSPGRAAVLDALTASLRNAEKSQIQVDDANDYEGNEDPSEEKHIQNVNSSPTEIFVPPEKAVQPCLHVFIALSQPMPDQLYGYICHADQSAPKRAKNRRGSGLPHKSRVARACQSAANESGTARPSVASRPVIPGRVNPNVKVTNLVLDNNVILTGESSPFRRHTCVFHCLFV